MLYTSHFARYFNFSNKNDPFLVHPSSKAGTSGLAQGGGAAGLKKIKGGMKFKLDPVASAGYGGKPKLTIPLQNQLMKIIR